MEDLFGPYFFTSEVEFLYFIDDGSGGVVVVGRLKEKFDPREYGYNFSVVTDIVYLHSDSVWRTRTACGMFYDEQIHRMRALSSGFFETREAAEQALAVASRGCR